MDEVPPSYVYTRMLEKLLEHEAEVERVFDWLVEELRKVLPGLGGTIAGDGKVNEVHDSGASEQSAGRGIRI